MKGRYIPSRKACCDSELRSTKPGFTEVYVHANTQTSHTHTHAHPKATVIQAANDGTHRMAVRIGIVKSRDHALQTFLAIPLLASILNE